MFDHLPPDSPARWLNPGEWQAYCPRKYSGADRCGFAAPVCTVGGGQMGCERCGGPLRVGEVMLDGSRVDFDLDYPTLVRSRLKPLPDGKVVIVGSPQRQGDA